MPRRTELADHPYQRNSRSLFSPVQRDVRLGHCRQSEVRCQTTLGNEKGLRAELLFDAGVQRRLLLQRGPRDEVAVEPGHERLPGRHWKLCIVRPKNRTTAEKLLFTTFTQFTP